MHDAERPALRVALAVRMVERLADLRGDQADLRQRHRLLPLAEALHELPQVAPGDVLHGDVEALLVLAELQHLDDVRVRELDRDARLVHEHADELGILAHGGKDLLDREQPLESLHAERLGDEHFRHATDGDPLEEEVLSELGGMAHGGGHGSVAPWRRNGQDDPDARLPRLPKGRGPRRLGCRRPTRRVSALPRTAALLPELSRLRRIDALRVPGAAGRAAGRQGARERL